MGKVAKIDLNDQDEGFGERGTEFGENRGISGTGQITMGVCDLNKSSKKNDPNNNQPARIIKSSSVYKGTLC